MLYVYRQSAENKYEITDSAKGFYSFMSLEEIKEQSEPILGILRYDDKVVYSPVYNCSLPDCLTALIALFATPQLQNFARLLTALIPPYFFTVAASTSGKYHPASDLGNGGLVRHTALVLERLFTLTSVEFTRSYFSITKEKLDLMSIACLIHDAFKCGTQEEYERCQHTRFDHPLIAANVVRGMQGFLPAEQLEFIAHCVESHMGQWNTSKYDPGVILPKPEDGYQYLVHLADYLASRRNYNTEIDGTVYLLKGTKVEILE